VNGTLSPQPPRSANSTRLRGEAVHLESFILFPDILS